jgi:hypothetical protein
MRGSRPRAALFYTSLRSRDIILGPQDILALQFMDILLLYTRDWLLIPIKLATGKRELDFDTEMDC